MKNLSLVLNIILLVAVAYLFIDHFSGEEPASTPVETNDTAKADHPLRIMVLNIDSLHNKSIEFQDKRAEMEQRQAGAEATMRKKVKCT